MTTPTALIQPRQFGSQFTQPNRIGSLRSSRIAPAWAELLTRKDQRKADPQQHRAQHRLAEKPEDRHALQVASFLPPGFERRPHVSPVTQVR
ncbi:MAG: hypothetical protein MZV49_20160 [Rhodopseudomonas palustris]|nr:hypothetical protein [Rhodopseudomonas palustris]